MEELTASEACIGPECDRQRVAHNLCKAHFAQQRRYGQLYPLKGPKSRQSLRQQAWWAGMSEEERQTHLAKMQAGLPRSRTDEHSRRLAEANRASWARKRAMGTPGERACRTCAGQYLPDDWRQYYCSKECRRLYSVLTKRGLTYLQYQAMLFEQGNVCALCGGKWKGWNGQHGPHVDHDHKTGRVRGILCGDCNTAIGRFGDDPVLLRRAAAYLERTF